MVPHPAALDLPHALVEWVSMLVVTREGDRRCKLGRVIQIDSSIAHPPSAGDVISAHWTSPSCAEGTPDFANSLACLGLSTAVFIVGEQLKINGSHPCRHRLLPGASAAWWRNNASMGPCPALLNMECSNRCCHCFRRWCHFSGPMPVGHKLRGGVAGAMPYHLEWRGIKHKPKA